MPGMLMEDVWDFSSFLRSISKLFQTHKNIISLSSNLKETFLSIHVDAHRQT